jgi:hypothetical protein
MSAREQRGRVGLQVAEEVQADYNPWRAHRAWRPSPRARRGGWRRTREHNVPSPIPCLVRVTRFVMEPRHERSNTCRHQRAIPAYSALPKVRFTNGYTCAEYRSLRQAASLRFSGKVGSRLTTDFEAIAVCLLPQPLNSSSAPRKRRSIYESM